MVYVSGFGACRLLFDVSLNSLVPKGSPFDK